MAMYFGPESGVLVEDVIGASRKIANSTDTVCVLIILINIQLHNYYFIRKRKYVRSRNNIKYISGSCFYARLGSMFMNQRHVIKTLNTFIDEN